MGIDSCLYEIPKNDLVDDMSCSLWPSVTFPMCSVALLLPHRNAGPETSLGKSWKHTTLWFPGGSSHYRCWSAILVTTAMMQPPALLSPILHPNSIPPLFNEGLGYHHGKIVELKMFVGWF